LKVLEEPPQRSLIMLVSHSPGRELPTIRSRCRRLLLRPLDVDDITLGACEATGKNAGTMMCARRQRQPRGARAGHSICLRSGLGLRQRVLDLLAQLPDVDARACTLLVMRWAGPTRRCSRPSWT
jgi:DNA polymerase-3 subunit delta'